MKMRVCDYIAKFIYDYGVKDVFMLSGGGIMHLTDGLACNRKLRVICCHHEQAASMAVEAYARMNGHFGAAYFTTGPGATNAITGLAGAWLDSVPCLFISGQAKVRETVFKSGIPGIRQIGVQEINIIPIVRSIVKYAAFVDNPRDIRYHLEKAVYMAKVGRPGPSWLDVPLDVQGALINTAELKGFNRKIKLPCASIKEVNNIASYITKSRRPVILAGQGVRISGAIKELLLLSERFGIPVVTTYLGIDILSESHPSYAGRIGIKGDRAGNLTVQNSDFLLIIGSSLPVSETGYEYDKFAREARIVVVDIDASSHKKNTIKIDKFIKSDARVFLKALFRALKGKKIGIDPAWRKVCIRWRKRYPVSLPEYSLSKNNRINIYYFVDRLSRRLKNGDVVISDAGSAFYATSQAVRINKGVRYITSGGFATMGYSLPAAIGVCAAINGRRVMCITGDGSFQQNIQELQTVLHYKMPIKIFVLNNNGYLSIRFTQKRYFNGRYIGEGPRSGVSFPDTKKIARAYGIRFARASSNNMLDSVLKKVVASRGPFICEIMTPPDQLIIPTVASYKKEDGSMVSRPLEDMFPFLDRREFKSNMFVKPVEE